MSIEIFCPKLVVSNIFAFLDHLKPKIFFFGHGGRHRVPPHFEISGSTSDNHPLFIYYFIGERHVLLGMYLGGSGAKSPSKDIKKTFSNFQICHNLFLNQFLLGLGNCSAPNFCGTGFQYFCSFFKGT